MIRLRPPPPPPIEPEPVFYIVTLPSVDGCETSPVAGSYLVESWSDFHFYLTVDTAYSRSQPVVSTSRNETLTPHAGDGAYVVGAVDGDVYVFIDGLVKNPPPVSNEPIGAGGLPKVWAEGSMLCVQAASSENVRVITASGNPLQVFRSVPGLTCRQLPTGIYIVQVGPTVHKVAIH